MHAYGPVEAYLDSQEGVKWPDIIGCGHFPFLVLSERALRAFSTEGIGEFVHYEVVIQPPLPKKLEVLNTPRYFRIDGRKMRGARLDFDSSGYVGVKFCPECGTRTDDIGATLKRILSRVYPFVFHPGSWNGANLFTTDLSPCSFFCTKAVLDCARKHRLTNFRFIPVEKGGYRRSKGLDYL